MRGSTSEWRKRRLLARYAQGRNDWLKNVLDTNVTLKTLIKIGVRGILPNPKHHFYVPEYAPEETRKHLLVVKGKTDLSESESDKQSVNESASLPVRKESLVMLRV